MTRRKSTIGDRLRRRHRMIMDWIARQPFTQRLVDRLIAYAQRTPYSHLWHPDGTPYMERFWIFRTRWCSARLHHILSRDLDPHMHDHPWSFVSLVLRGEYIEALPEYQDRHQWVEGAEMPHYLKRHTFSIARRRYCDRHRIVWLTPGGIWTLFITAPKHRAWGFHTPDGWVHWEAYPPCHADGAQPRIES